MQTKHFFSDPTHLVNSALHSLTLTNPSLAFDKQNKIIYRRPSKDAEPKVSIISGGGSGHEPAFAGFVGKGMLTASVAGTIFASPSAEQVRRALLQRVDGSKGVLVIVMNYTGDVLNFGLAAEKGNAAGIKTEFFAISDDVGVGRGKGGKVGRRGIGGGVMVLKIVGALAETGASLEEVYATAQLANRNIVSVGSSLEHVHVPGRNMPDPSSDDLVPHGEIEVGMGIFLKYDHSDRFALFINNLGGVSTLELSALTAEVVLQLERDYKIKPVRTIQGMFLTSLNGMGFSISLLRLADTGLGAGGSFLELLDAPSEAVGWAAPIQTSTWDARRDDLLESANTPRAVEQPSNLKLDPAIFKKVLSSGLDRVIKAEPLVTRYDTIVGDGDCGIGLQRGAEAILKNINDNSTPLTPDIITTLHRIIEIVENTMDGTSGAIYAIFLNALAHGLSEQDSSTPVDVTSKIWANALQHPLKALAKYTPAQPGDRTLMDALSPFISTLVETNDIKKAAEAANQGAESTKKMKASLGRAVYVGGEEEWVGKVPDPGAYGLSEFLNGLADGI
ncbi:dihydroxyacetone kinase Dak1 [Microsporum audouinii]